MDLTTAERRGAVRRLLTQLPVVPLVRRFIVDGIDEKNAARSILEPSLTVKTATEFGAVVAVECNVTECALLKQRNYFSSV